MKKLEITISKDGIKVMGDGKELIAPKAVTITMEGEEEQPTPEPEPDDKVVYLDDFNTFRPEILHTRLKQPSKDWAVLNNIAENQKSINMPANAQCVADMLVLSVKPETAKYGSVEKSCTSATVYSKDMFGKGRLNVRANLNSSRTTKNSIWATTSPMVDEATGLKYLYEFDIIEYTPAATGDYNSSRGMWCWQENQQSVSVDALPYNNLENKTSLSPGSWYWDGKGWTLSKVYVVEWNGNRLKGTNGMLYFITNKQRGVSIPSQDLEWIREDGISGKGLDGNKYFVVTEHEPIGKGAVKDQFIDGNKKMAGWHIWSLVVDDDFIAYECDGREYWRITNDQLHGLTIKDNIQFNVIFAASLVGSLKEAEEMQIDYVQFVPKDAKKPTWKEYPNEIEPYNGEL